MWLPLGAFNVVAFKIVIMIWCDVVLALHGLPTVFGRLATVGVSMNVLI